MSAIPRPQLGQASERGRRPLNQDASYACSQVEASKLAAKGQLFALADGMGEARRGQEASHLALRIIGQHYYDNPDPDPVRSLDRAVQSAQQALRERAAKDPAWQRAGTTFAAVLFHARGLLFANAGHSRAYLIRGGTIRQMSEDHVSPDNRKAPLRFLGGRSAPQVAVFYYRESLQAGDTVVLCSDGLTEMVAAEEIRAAASRFPPSQAAGHLVNLALRRGSADNVTAMILQWDPSASPQVEAAPSRGEGRRWHRLWLALPVVTALLLLLYLFNPFRIAILPTMLTISLIEVTVIPTHSEVVTIVAPLPTLDVQNTQVPSTPSHTPDPTAVSIPTSEGTPIPGPTPTPLPTAVVESEWPTRMEMGRSDWIRVSLIPVPGQDYQPTVEAEGHQLKVDSPAEVGTPGVPYAQSFGSGYQAAAVAHLHAVALECSPASMDYQALAQARLDFVWNCVPRSPGLQRVNVDLYVRWQPEAGGEEVIERQVWRGALDIQVTDPLIRTPQLLTVTLAGAILGPALTLPWFVGLVRRKKRKGEKEIPSLDLDFPYDVGAIRRLLLEAFTAKDLRRFCQDRPPFRPATVRFGPRHGLDDMVAEVIDYTATHFLWNELLREMQATNPRQYERFAPYLSPPDDDKP